MVNDVTASLQPSRGGLAALLGFKPNPVTDYIGSNRSALLGLAAGLAGGPTWGQGMSSGLQMAAQGGQMDQQQAEKLKAEAKVAQQTTSTRDLFAKSAPDLLPLLDSGAPMNELFNEYMKRQQPGYGQTAAADLPSSVQEYEYARQNGFAGTYPEWVQTGKNGASGPQLGMTPQWAIDPATNKYVMTQMSSDGRLQPTETGGLQPVSPFDMAGGKAGATVDAKTAAAARAAMRGAEVSNVNTAKAVADVRNNTKGMNEWFGQIGPRGVYINPGSEMGKFWAAAEPTNNQGFMQAREMLKGGGQITDYEGRKAEDAFSRMRASLEKGDQEQYLRALADFEEAVALGYQKLVETANGGYAAGTPGAAGAGNKTSTGVTWSVSP